MDPVRFDTMTKSLSTAGTRRGLVRLLAALPLGLTLTAVFGDRPEVTAKKKRQQDDGHGSSHRRHRRKAKHRHQTGNNKDNRKGKRKGKRKDKGENPGTNSCTKRTCPPNACGSQSDGCGGTLNCGCDGNTICDGGTCQACDVCASCTHTTIQQAIDAVLPGATATIRICAGTYTRSGTNPVANISNKNLTLIGAGAGATILSGGGTLSGFAVIECAQTTTEVRQLTVTGANGHSGIHTSSFTTTLTLADVTVTGNTTNLGGGIYNQDTLILNAGTIITGNSVGTAGGGIYTEGALTLNAGSSVTANSAPDGGGIFNAGGTVTLNAGASVTGNVVNNCAPVGSVPGCIG
jgi:hypothetical protein